MICYKNMVSSTVDQLKLGVGGVVAGTAPGCRSGIGIRLIKLFS